MKKPDLAQTIQILANLGVIAGIVVLVIEIQQNNVLMQSQTRSNVALSISDMLLRSVDSDHFEEFLAPEELAEAGNTDELRFALFQLSNFRIWENIYYQ